MAGHRVSKEPIEPSVRIDWFQRDYDSHLTGRHFDFEGNGG